jgi:FkbM family methyltransferase
MPFGEPCPPPKKHAKESRQLSSGAAGRLDRARNGNLMLRELTRTYAETLRYTRMALAGKLSVMTKGESAISPSCQIPDLRRKYLELGLPCRSGVFVEIGAFDGEQFSNTSFLADQGWRGVYVEPVPAFCRRIKHRHALNNIAIENVAISKTPGTCVLHMMESLSTTNPGSLEAYKSVPWARSLAQGATALVVKTDHLDSVLARHDIPNIFDLMIIDVEGAEEFIVRCLLDGQWRPTVLVVELCDIHPDFVEAVELQDSHRRTRERIVQSGYREFYSDPINSIFIRT